MALHCDNEPDFLRRPVVLLTRFFFRLCELRKVLRLWRRHWLEAWKSIDLRKEFTLGLKGAIEWPVWPGDTRKKKDAWSIFVLNFVSSATKSKSILRIWLMCVKEVFEFEKTFFLGSEDTTPSAAAATQLVKDISLLGSF